MDFLSMSKARKKAADSNPVHQSPEKGHCNTRWRNCRLYLRMQLPDVGEAPQAYLVGELN